MRADLERRLAKLDKQLPSLSTLGLSSLGPGLAPEAVYEEALKHLTVPEMLILLDLLDLRKAHLDKSQAEFYSYMTNFHRALLREWNRITRSVVREHIENEMSDASRQRKEELLRRALEELEENQPWLSEYPES